MGLLTLLAALVVAGTIVREPVEAVAACIVGWTFGGLLGRFEIVQRVFVRYRVAEVFERWGGAAVAVAALTPVPYAVTTWAAGAARVPFVPLFLGCLVRFVKVLIYLSLIVAGWSL